MGKFVEQVITCLNNCDIKIDEKMFDEANNFIAILGPPGSGKSTYCNTYYQYLLGTDIEYFQTQESKQTVTKGIWVLKKEVKSTSKNYIKRDIIDVEGFQTDSQACWKYAQAISLIATDIIILNQNTRMDEVIKIFKIIVQSIKMSNQGGIPQQLKQISISNKTEKQAKNFNVEEFLHLAEVQKADLNQIQVKSIYIPQISEDIKEEEGYDIYKDPKLVQSFIKSLNTISNSTNIQSVSGKFPNKWDLCTIKLDIDGKRDFEIALEGVYDYYKGLQEQKFDCLIQQSKYIYVAQSTGDLRCENGCKLNGKIVCGDCNGNLYWIKGSQNYVVCKDCDDVSQLISKVCSGCNGKSFSDIKYEKDFLNQKV
ncbi:hypothetical protein ABPG73_017893 [Tetrahymena malaccensis]